MCLLLKVWLLRWILWEMTMKYNEYVFLTLVGLMVRDDKSMKYKTVTS